MVIHKLSSDSYNYRNVDFSLFVDVTCFLRLQTQFTFLLVTSSLLGPNIFFDALFSNTLNDRAFIYKNYFGRFSGLF
jgi:hypothetical protein